MFIYMLTHKETFARAVVIAENERAAKEMRPDGAFWRDGAWCKFDKRGNAIRPHFMLLPCWPDSPDIVCADELGRAESKWAKDVVAFEPSDEPRKRGDGPDEWWPEPDHDDDKTLALKL